MKNLQAPIISRAVAVAAATAGTVMAMSGAADAGPTTQSDWSSSGASWSDPNDKGGVSVYEKGSKTSTSEDIMGQFVAYGEKVTIFDRHDNDRPAVVKLWVGDSGPAVFYGNGDQTTKEFNLSYDEGQVVKLEVCTSDSANAYCTTETNTGVS